MLNDFAGKTVLVTGGTKGLGLHSALAFGRCGARTFLTHRWGSADESEIFNMFEEAGAPAPVIVEADASRDAETKKLLEQLKSQGVDGIDIFISNVCVVMRGQGLDNHRKRALIKSLDYSAWPFVGYLKAIHEAFGRYPSYALAMSSDGPDTHYPGYDYVAVAKSVLETFVRYMNTHLYEHGCKVNALRTRQVLTDSYREIFGDDVLDVAGKFPEFACSLTEVADTALALCSGLFDSMSGQVVMLDRGAAYADNMATLAPKLFGRENTAATEEG